MKKLYVTPGIINKAIEESEMICSSITIEGTASENNITVADSRELHFNIWEEDAEEE